MARYRVLEMSFINDRIVQAGDEVDYAGDPGTNLEPLDDEAIAARDHYVNVKEPARLRAMADANQTSAVGDPAAFAQAMAKANADVIASQVSAGIAQAFASLFPNGLNKPPVTPAPTDAADPTKVDSLV